MPAKKYTRKRSRNSKNFVALPISGSGAIGSLADLSVVSDDVFSADLNEDLYMISADLICNVVGLTAGEGDPSMFGIAHGDYTDAEIAEKLNVALLGPGSKIEQERSRRLVRNVGPLYGNGLNTHTDMRLSGKTGPGITRTKIKFVIQSGKNLKAFLYNRSGGTITTGAVLQYSGTIYGRWML